MTSIPAVSAISHREIPTRRSSPSFTGMTTETVAGTSAQPPLEGLAPLPGHLRGGLLQGDLDLGARVAGAQFSWASSGLAFWS